MPSFSLAALTVLDLAPPALIDIAAACGYDAVGIRLLPAMPGGIAYPLEDKASLKETLARLDATGIRVADLEVVALRPETDLAGFSAFFETGARLGARHILVAGYDADLGRFSDSFAAFCEAAAPYGLTADLEFMPWTCVPDLATANRIVAPMRQANAGILVDALHFDRSRSSTAELARVPVHRLHYWQLCDGPAERPATNEELIHAARHERMFPGEGGIDLVSLARAMPADITVSLEVPTVELAKTMGHKDRAQRALDAARAVIAAARL
ncbi:TIM barrel protein [Bradyrhizobium sp. AUGA SZCCT0169]|uniref:sugar phosphate isomerase/epimerase family protein n=1 Tax=unclassified Bradyrhizobium TaxID=2631580 RepID=UPI001BAA87CF|nr:MULTISPECIES: TIM barrel protein [unclassified Bradyrhizobium]MBR1189500.1 TIM barrel protein [Bradyrhizobium sp. AUGA SZCCT0160]MBR1248651.1 TIM barrel protein [Bradyrhizobium sp. AUGA SZCCT0169]